MAADILSNRTTLWLNTRWGLPDTWGRIPPFSEGALSSRPNPAHRPKVGRQQLSSPAPMGLCSSLGNAWSIPAVTCVPSCVWRRSSTAVLLKDLAPSELHPCICDSIVHTRLFCSGSIKDLCSGWRPVWGQVSCACSCAVFWNLLQRPGTQHHPSLIGSWQNF